MALSKLGVCTASSATDAVYEDLVETYAVYLDENGLETDAENGTYDEAATAEKIKKILEGLAENYAIVSDATVDLNELTTTVSYTEAANTITDYLSQIDVAALVDSGEYETEDDVYAAFNLLLQLTQENTSSSYYYQEDGVDEEGNITYTINYVPTISNSSDQAKAQQSVSDKITELMTSLGLATDEESEDADDETESTSTILSNLKSAYATVCKYSYTTEETTSIDEETGEEVTTTTTTKYKPTVSKMLTNDYYVSSEADLASINEKISALKTTISDTNAEIAKYSDLDTGDYAGQEDLATYISDLAYTFALKVDFAYENVTGTMDASKFYNTGATRIEGQDSIITLNGAEYTSSSNSYSINGLTITASAVTAAGEEVSIVVDTDTQGLYDQIKDFLTQYNEIINELCSLYNASSASGYEPLTDDEKAEMTESEIEKWETKIKDAILRHDSTISSIIDTMVNSMNTTYTVNGKTYSLASFGISTLGYLNASSNENYAYHIDGDSDDSSTSSNTDKLLSMITTDPEVVEEFFKQLVSGLYSALGSKMSSSSVSSAFTIYNDKQLSKEYSEYGDLVEEWEEKISTLEDRYYSQFSAMETALSKLQAQSSALSSLLGS